MEAVPTKETTASLSNSFDECIRLFRTFLLALHDENCRVVRLKQVYLTEISDQCGRAKIWGDQMKADLPERARGSLDDTLRHDSDLKGLVEAIFMRLNGLLRQATYIAGRKYNPILGSDYDSISSVSAEDSDTGSASDPDDEDKPRSNRMPKICLLVQQITDQIRSLYDLSSLLRRPSIADKYIRSVNSKPHTIASDQPATLPLMASFSKLDESHIIEKVLQWRGLTKSGQSLNFENETPAQDRHSLTMDDIGDILWYCQRLARANTRRREQLQHWANHPYVSTQDKFTSDQPLSVLTKFPVKGLENKEESGSQASTLKPTSFKSPLTGPKSTMSKQSFSTAAVSDVHDNNTNTRSRTIYAPTNVGQGRSNTVPDPPKKDGKATFTCPYCGVTLESSEMENRQSWKRHVFRDLRPYICTFEHCQNPDKLYVSRHEWKYHELQIHRRKYVCKDCPKTYSSRTEMSTHVREHYGESISPAQLGVILDLYDQQDDGMNGEKDKCLVCGEELPFLALQGHLATHMEDAALFVLPNTQEGYDVGGTSDSVQARNLNSRGKLSDSESQTSSLGFSAAGDHGQTPADFSKLLNSEELGFNSKFTHWKVTDDPKIASLKALVQKLEDQNSRGEAVRALGSQTALPYVIIEAMGARLECRESFGLTTLSWAAMNGRKITVKRLIEKGADFDSRDNHGRSPLHLAAYNRHEAIVKILLEVGADDQMKDNAGDTPLSLATERGHEDIIQLLQQHASSPKSHQSSKAYQSTPHDAEDITSGISLAEIDFDSLSPLYKKVGPDWHVVFNPQLQRDLDVDLVHVFEHSTAISSLRFSHDGMHIATSGRRIARIFDIQTGEQVRVLDHDAPHADRSAYISSVSFSPDDRYLATGAGNSMVYLWDVESSIILARLRGHKAVVNSVEFSRDGKIIISGTNDTIQLWDVDTQANILTLSVEDMILSVAFSPDMQLIVSGSEDGSIAVWETRTGVLLTRLQSPEGHSGGVYSVAFSPSGETLVSASADNTIKLWHGIIPVQTQSPWEVKCIKTLQGHRDGVLSVAFTPDGNGLLSGSLDKSLQFWDPKTGVSQFMLRGHKSSVHRVAVSPNGDLFATASQDKEVRVWSYGPYQAKGT